MLAVNHIFNTLQGEATFTGTPSIFIRLQGCNVGCAFCDTKYTWLLNKTKQTEDITDIYETKTEDNTYITISEDKLVTFIAKLPIEHVVITGGEPFEQNIESFIQNLAKHKKTVQIETSGTDDFSNYYFPTNSWITLSPKLGNSIKGSKEFIHENIDKINEIKYPIGKKQDVENLFRFINRYSIINKDIWLQPLSQNKTATQLCIDTAKQYNFKVSIQTHKFIDIL